MPLAGEARTSCLVHWEAALTGRVHTGDVPFSQGHCRPLDTSHNKNTWILRVCSAINSFIVPTRQKRIGHDSLLLIRTGSETRGAKGAAILQ